jgi:cell division protein ZapA
MSAVGRVQVQINDKRYAIGCEDGQESHIERLARHFDGHVRKLAGEMGQIGEQRLFLMAALIIADELYEANQRTNAAEAELARRSGQRSEADAQARAAAAINDAASRIEALARKVDQAAG